jgi:GH24 family phage-related lysozyme (muramidase)
MKRIMMLFTLTAVLLTVLCFSSCTQSDTDKKASDYVEIHDKLTPEARYNLIRSYELISSIFPFVALIEGDHGEGKPYYDKRARWTVWYGSTVKPDGSLVSKNDSWIPRSKGKEYCFAHLCTRVFPYFKHFDRHKLTDEQIIGTALFIYNVGGEAVTGFDNNGNKTKQGPSVYFQAVNSGKHVKECVNYLTGFRKSGKRRAGGLLKRHWLEGAAMLGILTPDNILKLVPEQFYVTKNFGNYYWLDKKRRMVKDGDYYKLRYDETAVKTFFSMNTASKGQKSVKSII